MPMSQEKRKLLKWAWIILGALAAIFITAVAVMFWISGSRLERRLAAIRAADDPVSIADIKTEDIAADKDAATFLRLARGDAKSLTVQLYPIAQAADVRKSHLDSTEIEAIEAAFAAYPQVMPLIEQAADCPTCSVDYSKHAANTKVATDDIMQNVEQRRMFARLLYQYRFFLLMSKGKHDDAVQNCITLLRLSRLSDNDPTLMNFMANGLAGRGIAIEEANEALQAGRVSDNVRQELENQLAKIDIRRAYLQTLKTERAYVLDNIEQMSAGKNWFSLTFLNREKHGCLDMFEWLIARATAALPENASNTPTNISPTPPSSGPLGLLLLPSMQAVETAANRVEAEISVLRIINALGRRDDPQKPPLADLSDLGLPESATTDPFSDAGKPLIVKKVDGGWLVYSVGENKVDDGGDVDVSQSTKLLDIGLRPVVRTKPTAHKPKSQ
ncbi:MAG: hypothetical protein JXM70_10300 [Pirellulales bacterium]|nr:hypothetical protein [Pirellulales bacterium]